MVPEEEKADQGMGSGGPGLHSLFPEGDQSSFTEKLGRLAGGSRAGGLPSGGACARAPLHTHSAHRRVQGQRGGRRGSGRGRGEREGGRQGHVVQPPSRVFPELWPSPPPGRGEGADMSSVRLQAGL